MNRTEAFSGSKAEDNVSKETKKLLMHMQRHNIMIQVDTGARFNRDSFQTTKTSEITFLHV